MVRIGVAGLGAIGRVGSVTVGLGMAGGVGSATMAGDGPVVDVSPICLI